MKKKNYYLILLLLVGLFIPKDTFAADLHYVKYIDYRFFVEDKDKNDVEGLQFKIHDINNTISFESKYDSENKTYNIIDISSNIYLNQENVVNLPKLPNDIFSKEIATEFENFNSNDYNEWYEKMEYLIEKYPSIDYYQGTMEITIPMILEETSGKYDNPIKKVIFGKVLIYYFGSGRFFTELYVFNNDCTMLSQVPMYDEYQKDMFKQNFIQYAGITRKNAYDYSDEVLSKFSNGNFASPEINSNNYQNRCSNRIASAEIASEEINANLTKEGREEETLADYCECLPLFTQERKEIITINPATWNTGFVVLLLSMILVTGSSFVLIKKKS